MIITNNNHDSIYNYSDLYLDEILLDCFVESRTIVEDLFNLLVTCKHGRL